MKKEIYINPAFKHLSAAINSISENFENKGELTHTGRNQVRVIDVNGFKMVAKYFKRITIANRYIYATIRKSKAQRSFENSVHLFPNQLHTLIYTSSECFTSATTLAFTQILSH